MSIWVMIWREIVYRKINFLLGVAGVIGAVGILIGMLTSLEIHDARSESLIAKKEAETKATRAVLSADVRKAMQRLGYNAIILPKDQPLGDWYAEDYATRTMAADTAARLAKTKGLADRYVAQLRRKIKWTEKKWTIIVVGLGTEHVLDTSVCDDIPLVDTIKPGTCVVGHELQAALGLEPGQTISLEGQKFRIATCKKELGTKDDITIWLNLADAQALLKLPGQINEILLVEHLNVWGNLAEVRKQVAGLLPNCQVIEIESETMSRSHARVKVAEEAKSTLAQERAKRVLLHRERLHVLTRLVPLCALVCAAWIGLLVYTNVRDRRQETGTLMAIGFPARDVRTLFVAKALVIGILGGLFGFLIGGGIAMRIESRAADMPALGMTIIVEYLVLAVIAGAVVCLLGSWLPVRSAMALDPAEVLHEE